MALKLKRQIFDKKRKKKVSTKKDPIWNWAKLAKMPNKPMGELSEDDKIIYGI